MSSSTHAPPGRIGSLDQFRGYTVAGMLLVNFLGGYAAAPAILKHHHTYCSYADTIMPQFFFAVGFAYRLTFLKRLRDAGAASATAAVLRRNAALIVLGVVLYHLDGRVSSWAELTALGPVGFVRTAFQRMPFQTLVHIALASLWVLPVIGAGAATRVVFLVASGALHLGLSAWFYFDWAWRRPVIDGGPLGFMTWSIPLLVGSLAYDVVASRRAAPARLAGWGAALMAAGYGLSLFGGPAAPPFVPPSGEVTLWTMSQRTGSVSYLVFAAGVSLVVYSAFVVACDRAGREAGVFRTFGRNALAAYVLHEMVIGAVKPYAPRDAPGWYVLAAFGLFFAVSYGLVRGLERQGVFKGG
jgi:predicted acyltransferase